VLGFLQELMGVEVKKLISLIFNLTVGRFIRLCQQSLTSRPLFQLITQQALVDSSQYALNNFSTAVQFDTRRELWSYCLNRYQLQTKSGEEGIIAEFGVWKGKSINFFAKNCPKLRVFGFDSFEGLEEDWYGFRFQKGAFNLMGRMPKTRSNVTLVKGWFEDTLPKFCEELQQEKILLLHMDADTYKPTAYVLNSLFNNLGKGTLIIFDEYFGYTNFQLHEFRAWRDLVESKGIKYKYVGYTQFQCAIEIL
jgi:hypothetical protein